MIDYKKIAYGALQRVNVSTTWKEDTQERVAEYLKNVFDKKLKSNNSGDKDTPKLPSLDDVREEAAKIISGDGIVTAVYRIIERLGNFT